MLQTKSGTTIDLIRAKEIAAGGEGKIFEHPTDKKKVIKLYHQVRLASFAKHLSILSSLGKEFIKPGEVYYINGKVAGFAMDYVNFNDYWLFNNLFNKGFCNSNKIDNSFKTGVLMQLKASLESLHATGIVVGDLNQYNLFVSKNGKILFVDVDSYATKEQLHSGVLLDEIRDWTTMNINKETDAWAYDILAFWTTTFCHPFKWVAPGNSETLEQRVKAGKSFLTKITNLKVPPLYQPPTGDVLKQFQEIFNGRRYMIDLHGIHIPVPVQVTQAVHSASVNIREIATNVLGVHNAGNYITIHGHNNEWTLVETSIAKITRDVKEIICDEMYPAANGKYIIRTGSWIEGSSGSSIRFNQPEFYYADGSIAVFDYGTDTQWNINVANQVGALDCISTPVFAKSIIVRDAPIQNFGGAKFLNVPFGNKYTLVKVPQGTKNAVYCNHVASIEYVNKRKTVYQLLHPTKQFTIDLDYLPHFAVKDNLVFVPDNGTIQVYMNFAPISTLDVPNCTRDSKLYSTTSGILMLENNSLYLLNTK